MTACWHVALIWPGHEQPAFLKLQKASRAVIFPRWVEQRTLFGKQVEVLRPMASGYLIIHFDGHDPVDWHEVRELCGEGTGFIGGADPQPIAQSEIDLLLARSITQDGMLPIPVDARVEPGYKNGDRVRILGSAEGVVVWSDRRGCRVSTIMFGRQIDVWFPHAAGQLEKLREDEWQPQTAGAPRYLGRRYKKALHHVAEPLYARLAESRTVAAH